MTIDLRSDTVTKPSKAMRETMAAAPVGDDVYGEDPTINRLEESAAALLETDSALFCASGTQGNLLALLAHCQRGDEFIVGQNSHTYQYEGGGAAALGSMPPQPLDFEADGTLDLDKVAAVIKPDDYHFPPTKLLCLENTRGGSVLPMDYLQATRRFVDEHGLGLHLDGARIFNASIALGIPVADISRHFDSISFCLSKGLGAPVGTLLCGDTDFITEARRWRKTLGGGMRQAGIIAAAGLYALENHIERLAEDHANALSLARGLGDIDRIAVTNDQTNMVYIDVGGADSHALTEFLHQRGVLIQGQGHLRLVTHLDIDEKDIETAIAEFKEFFST